MASYVVIRSELINTATEAKKYYAERIAGAHEVSCHGKNVRIFFESSASHMFSEEPTVGIAVPIAEQIVRRVQGGRVDVRRFSLDRARLMDRALEAVANFRSSAKSGPRDSQ